MKFFKKLGIQAKLIFGVIIGALGIFLFLLIRGKIRAKDQLNYELNKVKNEIEMAHLKEETEESDQAIKELEKKKELLLEKIKVVEDKEVEGQELSIDELEDFFADRGF